MSRPEADVLSWATNLMNRETPSAGKRVEGFVPTEGVPSQEVNALFGNLFDWLAYLSGTRQDSRTVMAGLMPWTWSMAAVDLNLGYEADGTSGTAAGSNAAAHNALMGTLRGIPNVDQHGTLSITAVDYTCDQVAALSTGVTQTYTTSGGAGAPVGLTTATGMRLQKGSANATNASGFTARASVPSIVPHGGTVASVKATLGAVSGASGSSAVFVQLFDGAGHFASWYLDPSTATPSAVNAFTKVGGDDAFVGPIDAIVLCTLDGSSEGDLLEIDDFTISFA